MKVVYDEKNIKLYYEQATSFLNQQGIREEDGSVIIIEDIDSYMKWIDKIIELKGPKELRNPLYQHLFARAQALLADNGVKDDGDNIIIQDLPSYYRWLDIIEQIGGPEFLRIPFEEDCFEIDTDTRNIVVPSELDNGKWVVGVKDDHLAEVLWFHVDRFYDGQDLAICFPAEGETIHKGQTYVQWKNSAGYGLDPVQHVQIDENNIWFGWYLRSNEGVLNVSGDLTFSIRFQYHNVGTDAGPDVNSEVLFSFNTLPITCKVLTNLTESMGTNVNGIKDLNIENINAQGMVRPRFSGVFDSTRGPKAYIDKDNDLPEFVDLIDGEATLTIIADGSGVLHYRWYKNGKMIEGEEANTCVVDSVGVYTAQVGNGYDPEDPTKIRWTDSNPCEVPEASELEFAENGNIMEYGYADGKTPLSVNIEKINDSYGRKTGEISYTWYRDALEGEVFEDGTTTEEVANTETYTPIEGEVGYYYVVAVNEHNGDRSEPLESNKCTMKIKAETPNSVTIVYNNITHTFTTRVDILHHNDLYYEWHCEGKFSEAATLGKDTYKVTVPGTYYCKVYQHIYPDSEALMSISEMKPSNFEIITEDELK